MLLTFPFLIISPMSHKGRGVFKHTNKMRLCFAPSFLPSFLSLSKYWTMLQGDRKVDVKSHERERESTEKRKTKNQRDQQWEGSRPGTRGNYCSCFTDFDVWQPRLSKKQPHRQSIPTLPCKFRLSYRLLYQSVFSTSRRSAIHISCPSETVNRSCGSETWWCDRGGVVVKCANACAT